MARRLRFHAAVLALSLLLVGLVASSAMAAPSLEGCQQSISINPDSGEGGTEVAVMGTGYCTSVSVAIRFRDADGTVFVLQPVVPVIPGGTFATTVTIPTNAALGIGRIAATDRITRKCAWVEFEVTAPG